MPSDYFKLFDIPRAFDVDIDQVSARYRDLQRAVHPDRFAQSTPQERRLAMEQASEVNQGFRTLKDPVERALHLLRLAGVDVEDLAGASLDSAFLMEQMELRESLSELKAGKPSPSETSNLEAAIDRLGAKILADLRDNFSRGSDALRFALRNVQKLRFVNKLRAEVRDLHETC